MLYIEFMLWRREMDGAPALNPVSWPSSLQGGGLCMLPSFNLGQTK